MTIVNVAKSPFTSAITIALVATIAGAPGAAQAQSGSGLYGRIDGGYSPSGEVDITIAAPVGGDVAMDDGFIVSGAVGYAFDGGFRIEGEVSHRANDLKPDTLNDPGGQISATSLMANAYYDFGGQDSRLNPYLGGGVGVAFADLQDSNSRPLIPVVIDENANSLAYQLMAGVAVGLSENVDVDIGYRYFVVSSIKGQAIATPTPSIPFKADAEQHGATIGLRFRF